MLSFTKNQELRKIAGQHLEYSERCVFLTPAGIRAMCEALSISTAEEFCGSTDIQMAIEMASTDDTKRAVLPTISEFTTAMESTK